MTYTTNIRLPDDLGERLTAFSDDSGIPRNTVIRKALEGYLPESVAPQPAKKVLKRSAPKTKVKK